MKRMIKTAIKYRLNHPGPLAATILIMALFTGMFCFGSPKSGVSMGSGTGSYEDALSNPVWSAAYSMIDHIAMPADIEKIRDMVVVVYDDSGLLTAGGRTLNISGLQSLYGISSAIAILAVTATFFIGFINSRNDETEDEILKRLTIWIVSIGIAITAQTLTFSVADIGTLVADKVAAESEGAYESTGADEAEKIKQALFDALYVPDEDCEHWYETFEVYVDNCFHGIGLILKLCPPYITMFFISLILYMTAWKRTIQIVIMGVFSPFAFTDAVDTSRFGQGAGKRFVKGVLAVGISGAVILVAMSIGQSMAVSALQEAIQTLVETGSMSQFTLELFPFLSIGIAEAGIVLRSEEISKQIVGL